MNKLIVFNSISLDGFFTDKNGELKWTYNSTKDEEWDAFVVSNASGGGMLLFGRITYDLMASYWPTSPAMKNFPVVAERMNQAQKIVFSRTLNKTAWINTRLVKDGVAAEIRKLKNGPGPGMAILGSGSIVSQLTQEGLIDEYQFVIVPVLLGDGRTLFEDIKEKVNLKLIDTRVFKNGNVFLRYIPGR